jgi:hypothetical protein
MPPRNSDTYSLLILDEHLWKWIDACSASDSLLSHPNKEDSHMLLKRILSIWPVLLKLMNLAQSSKFPPAWIPYVIRAADRLILAARDIPMKAIRASVDDILSKISEIESKSVQLVEMQVEKERLYFMSNYSSVESLIHKAVEYWPVWEPHVRNEALSVIRDKLNELHQQASDRRSELEKMHLDQLNIRDRWAEMRLKLHPEQYEDSSAWWGSAIKPSRRVPINPDSDLGIPEYVVVTENRVNLLQITPILEASRSLTRIHLNSAAVADGSQTIPWSLLRAACLELMRDLTVVIENRKITSSLIVASVNMIDILLRLLFCYDLSQFDEEEAAISDKILKAKEAIDEFNRNLSGLNPSGDAVVARFTADEKTECMQAAIAKFTLESRMRMEKRREELVNEVISLQAQLNTIQSYKQTNYENPWEDVWRGWSCIVGDNMTVVGSSSGISTPHVRDDLMSRGSITPQQTGRTSSSTNTLPTATSHMVSGPNTYMSMLFGSSP